MDVTDDELFRCRLFRGMNMRFSSSGFIWWPPLTPHAGRLCWVKVGGLATAVMRGSGECDENRDSSGLLTSVSASRSVWVQVSTLALYRPK